MNLSTDTSLQFQGQGMIVIGGATDIGRSIVVIAAQRGASIVVDCQSGSAAAVDHLLAQDYGAGVAASVSGVAVDALDEAGVEELFDKAVDRLPRFSLLIHCLAMPAASSDKTVAETTSADWEVAMRCLFREPFLCSQRAIQEFLAAGEGGRIVYAVSNVDEGAVSEVAQLGLRALVRSVAKEYGLRGIACNAVMTLSRPNTPGRAGDSKQVADELAEGALFLGSSQASFVNGEALYSATPAGTPVRWRHIR